MTGARPLYHHVPGSPCQPYDSVRVKRTIDGEVMDLSHHVGKAGIVLYLEYECGSGQQYPGDPMVGVLLEDFTVEEFWAEELGRRAVRS